LNKILLEVNCSEQLTKTATKVILEKLSGKGFPNILFQKKKKEAWEQPCPVWGVLLPLWCSF
jgi:hypothetical protein